MFLKKKVQYKIVLCQQNVYHVRIHLFSLAKTAKRHFYLNLELVMQRPDKTLRTSMRIINLGQQVREWFCYFV